MDAKDKTKKTMPKGGRKGGAVFPRTALDESVANSKKLVSKTHVQPQPLDIIYSGVVGAKSGRGAVKISALKQYGFLQGSQSDGFSATDLAKKISSAPIEELDSLYQQAALRPAIFKAIYDTFHGDSVSRAKLKQRAADIKVHPDETETCVDVYIKSLQLAKLLEVNGDQVIHKAATAPLTTAPDTDENESTDGEEIDQNNQTAEAPGTVTEPDALPDSDVGQSHPKPRAVFNVNVTLDSSLDTEKLAKQLELLKRFGAI